MTDYGLDLAVIGNGRTAALLDPSARITWWCLPRYDGDPVFCRLLSGSEEKGFTDIVLEGQVETRSDYVRNTATVVTDLIDHNGGAVRVTAFARRIAMANRSRRDLPGAITSVIGATRYRFGSPRTRRSPTSRTRRRSF